MGGAGLRLRESEDDSFRSTGAVRGLNNVKQRGSPKLLETRRHRHRAGSLAFWSHWGCFSLPILPIPATQTVNLPTGGPQARAAFRSNGAEYSHMSNVSIGVRSGIGEFLANGEVVGNHGFRELPSDACNSLKQRGRFVA